MRTAKDFAEEHQYDLAEHDEGGYLGINEDVFAKLLDEYADQKVNELNKTFLSSKKDLLFTFIKEIKSEFKDENWDYLDFIAERVINKQ